MDLHFKIINGVPFFRHCTAEEVAYLQTIGSLARVRKGQTFDLKKSNTFNIVINGLFEIESLGKTDIVYLSPGSFFGNLPFTENRQRGIVRAVVDSNLMLFEASSLMRFFLMYYRGLRGYLRSIGRMGFDLIEAGNKYMKNGCRITAVTGHHAKSGKSLLSALLGMSLSSDGRTIVLDLSRSGASVFDIFGKKLAAPLSNRPEGEELDENFIMERIEKPSDDLHLLNVAFGSRVRVNEEILSPLLFILSREYRHIVLDVSTEDAALWKRSLGLSDNVFLLLRNEKEISEADPGRDAVFRDGQRLYYVVNEHVTGDLSRVSGGLILEKLGTDPKAEDLASVASGAAMEKFRSLVVKKKRALVLETNLWESCFYGGFFLAMEQAGIKHDLYYSSGFSYIVLILFLLSRDAKDFRKGLLSFFTAERLNKLLDISFPEEHVFRSQAAVRFFRELAGDRRAETLERTPLALLEGSSPRERRMFSTGLVRDLAAAGFLISPVFESLSISGGQYHSGYPQSRVRIEDLFRTDTDEIDYLSVSNPALSLPDSRLLGFYGAFAEAQRRQLVDDKFSEFADRSFIIEASERELRPEKILDLSENISNKLLKENRG